MKVDSNFIIVGIQRGTINKLNNLVQIIYLCFIFSLKGKEVDSLVYGAIISAVLYLYLMHYVTEETRRVAHLGFACMFFTVAMQASPLAAVVCKLNSLFNGGGACIGIMEGHNSCGQDFLCG